MASIYIAYGSVEGQTAHIAEYIADVIRAHGHHAETADLKHAPDSIPDGQDAVIVAASVHVGKHEGYVADFVRKNRSELNVCRPPWSRSALPPKGMKPVRRATWKSSRRRPAGTPAM